MKIPLDNFFCMFRTMPVLCSCSIQQADDKQLTMFKIIDEANSVVGNYIHKLNYKNEFKNPPRTTKTGHVYFFVLALISIPIIAYAVYKCLQSLFMLINIL